MKKLAKFTDMLPGIFGLILFCGMLVWLIFAVDKASASTEAERLRQVKQSIENGITLCYSIEGAYPESLEQLTENYGIVIDEKQYIVHYERFAANVRPTVVVIRREN